MLLCIYLLLVSNGISFSCSINMWYTLLFVSVAPTTATFSLCKWKKLCASPANPPPEAASIRVCSSFAHPPYTFMSSNRFLLIGVTIGHAFWHKPQFIHLSASICTNGKQFLSTIFIASWRHISLHAIHPVQYFAFANCGLHAFIYFLNFIADIGYVEVIIH